MSDLSPEPPSLLDAIESCISYGREGIDDYRLAQQLGFDPSLPLSVFRERLRLGALVQEAPYTDAGPIEYRLGWNRCLEALRGSVGGSHP